MYVSSQFFLTVISVFLNLSPNFCGSDSCHLSMIAAITLLLFRSCFAELPHLSLKEIGPVISAFAVICLAFFVIIDFDVHMLDDSVIHLSKTCQHTKNRC